MSDAKLTQLLINLAEAIRDVPQGQVQQTLGDRFFAVLAHLESRNLIRRDQLGAFHHDVDEVVNSADQSAGASRATSSAPRARILHCHGLGVGTPLASSVEHEAQRVILAA